MKLPNTRDARDSFFLIAVVLLTVAPHLPRLPAWAGGAVLGLLAWRGWLAARAQALPARWLLVLLLGAVVMATWLAHGALIGREPGLTLVSLLLVMKLLELHARRDAFVVFFLGFFLVLAQYFHSQSLWVALWTLAAVWGLLTSVVLAQMPLGQPSLRVAAREAARSTALGLPVMLLLFLLFPRIGPLWGVPGASGSSGLSDRMAFGDVAELALNESLALRLRPLPGSALPAPLYIRGPVLSTFDGQQWRAEPLATSTDAPEGGRPMHYEAMTEPQRMPLLPLVEWAPGAVGSHWTPQEGLPLRRAGDLSWLARRPIVERLRFEQTALVGAVRVGPLDWQPALRMNLQLPPGLNPRLRAWARAQAMAVGDGPERAARLSLALLTHIRTQPFTYTLAPGVYGQSSPHAIDEFWFERRAGFCEHYAAAYVVAMRAAGVPARVVTGFLGADEQTLDGWTLVRNSHAHAWAEYWHQGRGWLRVDPTGAVAPERVERSQLQAASPGLLRGAVDALNPTLWRQLRRLADQADLRWQEWVLGYQRQQQFKLLEALGFDAPGWETLGRVAAACIALVALGAWAAQRGWGHARSPWRARLAHVHALLRAHGVPAQAHEAPLRWAEHVPPRRAAARQALLELEAWRYGPPTGATTLGWRAKWADAWRWRQWQRRFQRALAQPMDA